MMDWTISRRSWLLAAPSMWSLLSGPAGSSRAAGETVPLARPIGPLSPEHRAPVIKALAIDPLGQQLAMAGDDNRIRVLAAADLDERERLNGHRDLVRSLAFDPSGQRLVSACNAGRLIIWQRADGWQPIRRIDSLPAIFALRFSPDGSQLAAAGFQTGLLLFDADGRRKTQLRCQCRDLRGLVFRQCSRQMAVVGRSGMLHLFDARSGSELGEFPLHPSRIRDIALLPGCDRVVTVGEDGAAIVFDLEQLRVVHAVNLLPCKLFSVVAVDSQTVAVAGSDNRIRLVDCHRGRVTALLEGHRGSISSLAFAKGFLYSGGFDTTIRKWTLPSGQEDRVAKEGAAAEKR